MRETLDVVGQALEDVWDNLFFGAACSLLWLALTLLVIPAPGALLVLVEVAQQVHRRESPTLGDYWRLVWKRFALGWRWAALSLPIPVILWADYLLAPIYFAPPLAGVLQMAALIALGICALVLAYSLPLLFLQEQPSVRQSLRNAGVMARRNPLFSLTLLLIALLFVWVSLLILIVNLLAGPIFVAFLTTRAVDSRLKLWRTQQTTP